MNKIVVSICAFLLTLAQTCLAADYQYISAADMKGWLEADKPMLIVDIQVKDQFAKHHIKGSVETNAYPVKSDSERATIDPAVAMYKNGQYESVVVVCPRGKGGAKRAHDYLKEHGVPDEKLVILTGGMDKWPYADWVEERK